MTETEVPIATTQADGIARVTIARPEKRNAMTLAMWRRLGEIFTALGDADDVRVIILASAGDACFCAGNDIAEFETLRATPDQIAEYHAVTQTTYTAIRQAPKPTIVRIQGICMGGGLELSQLCDIQIAADSASFGVPPAKLGLGYSLDDTLLLVAGAGAKAAKEMLLTGRRFAADDALRWGLVTRVVPAGQLDATVDEYALEIASNAPLSLRAGKLMVNEAAKEAAARDLALCDALVAACDASADVVEGRRAFTEKRKPQFEGR